LARCCNHTKCGKKVQDYYAESQFWGTPIDFMTSAYIELVFACLINWTMFTSTRETDQDFGLFINNVYLCCASVLVVVYPIGLCVFLKKNYYDLHYEAFKAKFGNAYDGIELFDNKKAIWIPVLFFLRRAALAVTLVCLSG